jgi:hypothetical protein
MKCIQIVCNGTCFSKFILCVPGEVSDSDSDNSSNNLSAPEEFDDGLDENLIRDDEDRRRLEQMTEKEREQELFNRIEKREVLRTRYVLLSLPCIVPS